MTFRISLKIDSSKIVCRVPMKETSTDAGVSGHVLGCHAIMCGLLSGVATRAPLADGTNNDSGKFVYFMMIRLNAGSVCHRLTDQVHIRMHGTCTDNRTARTGSRKLAQRLRDVLILSVLFRCLFASALLRGSLVFHHP